MTEVGQKGLNLSDGQQAKICLARAIYADTDIILLDDIVADLDETSGKKIVSQVFMNLLKFKTRVLVSNSVDIWSQVDRIILLKDGRIQAVGTYTELKTDPNLLSVLSKGKMDLK